MSAAVMLVSVLLTPSTPIPVSAHASVQFEEDFESGDLSPVRWRIPGSALVLADPLDPTNHVVGFGIQGSGGDLFSVLIPNQGQVTLCFDFLKTVPVGYGFIGLRQSSSLVHTWLWNSDNFNVGIDGNTLVNQWTHVCIPFTPPYAEFSLQLEQSGTNALAPNVPSAFFDNISLDNNTGPVATCTGQTVDAGPACTAVASIDAGSFDPDSGDTITVSQAPPGPFSLGSAPATLTVTDNHGASDVCSANVIVIDSTSPVVSCPTAVVVECSGFGSGSATIAGSATDNCSVLAPNCTAASGSFPLGTTTYLCLAADGSGNSGSCNSSVTVVDTTAPTATCMPAANPAGKNNPNANAGFRQVGGGDSCSAVSIMLGGYALSNGETIKLTVSRSATGVTFVGTMGPSAIRNFVVGPGFDRIVVFDGVLSSSVSCGA